MLGKKILIIDDDVYIRQITERAFEKAGAEVISASSGNEGLRRLYENKPDLVILDIVMPETDGYATCRQIRRLSDVPIIMLTALNLENNIVHGLDTGADDYVTKPFSQDVLLARARSLLRRTDHVPSDEKYAGYADDYLSINLEMQTVQVNGTPVRLSRTENKLLTYLVQHKGRVLSFKQILESVWGWEYQDSFDYVHVYISHLRKKIEQDPKKPVYFHSEHGMGYRFEKLDEPITS